MFYGGSGNNYFNSCYNQSTTPPSYSIYTGGQGNYNYLNCYTQDISNGNDIYNGGDGIGNNVSCFIESNSSFNNPFYGGNGHTSVLSCYSQNALDTYTMFYGGNSATYMHQCYEQINITSSTMYYGSNGANYFLNCYEEGTSLSYNMYTGGISTNANLACHIENTLIGENLFGGGEGDGFDVNCRIQGNAIGTMIYGGGNSDGFEFLCYQESNAQTLNMYSGGISNQINLKCFQQLDYLIIALPIELLDFTATPLKKEVLLNWSTSSEIDASHFEVERSNEGLNFEYIDELSAIGNSNQETKYELLDKEPLKGISYYRLKQIDNNGDFKYSKIIAVNFKKSKTNKKPNLLLYPNPVIDKTTLQFDNFEDSRILLSIYNISGVLILEQKVNLEKSNTVFEFILPQRMSSGTYIVNIKGLETSSKVSKKLIVN